VTPTLPGGREDKRSPDGTNDMRPNASAATELKSATRKTSLMANAAATDRGNTIAGRFRQSDSAAESGADLWLLCTAGSHRFALPIANVIETMRVLPVETVAGAPSFVRGLSVIHGAAVPVLDTARLFGAEAARYERLVTVRTGERTVAFAASAVLAVQSIDGSQPDELPPLLQDADTIGAVARLDEELVFFLRTARALPDDFHVSGDAPVEDS
jgi:purine-binding chemotaxis protein CheW